MKKLLCLLLIAQVVHGANQFEKFVRKNSSNKYQEIALRIGCSVGAWVVLSFGVELNYYVATLLRRANHALIDSSVHSAHIVWDLATDEPKVIPGRPLQRESTVITLAKIIGYSAIAALPVGICYLAIS